MLADVEDLPELEAEWAEISDEDRYTTYQDWDENAAKLEDLEETYRAAQMTPEQEERYLLLKAKLRECAPILERLGLDTPPASILQDD